MFRRGGRSLAIVLVAAALALSAGPAAAAGGEAGATRSLGMEVWAKLDQLGDWLRAVFMADGSPFIDPNGYTSFIDPNGGTSHSTSDYTPYIDPNG